MSVSWRGEFQQLKAMVGEFYAGEGRMSQYQRDSISQDIQRKRAEVGSYIQAGALAEHARAIVRFQESQEKRKAAAADELKRWDSRKLKDELDLFRSVVEAAVQSGDNPLTGGDPLKAVSVAFREAMDSGEIHKIRAAALALRVDSHKLPDPGGRAGGYGMAAEAEKALAALRRTPGMVRADEEHLSAVGELMRLQGGLVDVAQVVEGRNPLTDIFNPGEIAKAMRRVKLSPGGEVEILPADDIIVQGWGETEANQLA